MKELDVTEKEAGQRLDKFLAKYMPVAPMSFFYKMMRKKNIVLNRRKAEGKEILKVGDKIALFLAEDTILGFQLKENEMEAITKNYIQAYQKWKNISVIFENEHMMVVHKPVNMLSQKDATGETSLNEWVIGYLLTKGKITKEELKTFKPSVVNRLDRNTSGLVLAGISLKGSQILSAAIKEHTFRKFYRAICIGKPKQDKGHLKGYLVKDGANNKVRITKDGNGDRIETKYEVLSTFHIEGKEFSYLEIELITGKSHQIRAHMASLGHPLLGDEKYGNAGEAKLWKKKLGITGQLLHAYRLAFPEDTLKELGNIPAELIAPLPVYFDQILSIMADF